MIAVRDLGKRFGRKEVLHSINLSMGNGCYGLLGANGAGKTTLIRCMAGLFEAQKGEVLYDNRPIHRLKGFQRDLGYLPQAFGMLPELTLHEMMDYMCSLKGIPRSQCAGEIAKALEFVNLEERARERVRTLSGGMVRRAGIAQAILGDPKVLLLDEPTAGLDPSERARFRNSVRELKRDRTVLLSTHIVEDVDACCDNVIVIHGGRILFSGPSDELREVAVRQAGHKGEKPTIEDGYLCLTKGIA